jgi:hypothetical protein
MLSKRWVAPWYGNSTRCAASCSMGLKFLTSKGYLVEEQGMSYRADSGPETVLAPFQQGACT